MVDGPGSGDTDGAASSEGEFENFGDYSRQLAANHAHLAEKMTQHRRGLVELVNKNASSPPTSEPMIHVPITVEDVLSSFEEMVQRFRLTSSVSAAQAVAWDDMQAAGGEADPQAWAAYGAATEFHTALLTDAAPEPDGSA